MNASLILLHEEALRITHPVFHSAPPNTNAIFVWDDAYFRAANYSLKRLIFIYETLCALPVEIIHADTLSAVRRLAPSTLYIPATRNPLIVSTLQALLSETDVRMIEDEPFVKIKNPIDFRRFFQYWKKVEKHVFTQDGGSHA